MQLEDTPQADEPQGEVIQPVAQPVPDAGQAPADNDSEDQPAAPVEEPVTFESQAKVDELFAPHIRDKHNLRREKAELEQRVKDLQSRIPQEQRPEVPDAPDPYSDSYEQDVVERDAKIQERAEFDTRGKFQQDEQQRAVKRQQEQQQQNLAKAVTTYSERAKSLGISDQDLQSAAEVVNSHGINDSVAVHILQDDQGPAITQYLARHPTELATLHGLSPMAAAIHIENVVKPAASSSRKTTNAPAPATELAGGGSPPSTRGPKGATFE
jgi:hypothetical protein